MATKLQRVIAHFSQEDTEALAAAAKRFTVSRSLLVRVATMAYLEMVDEEAEPVEAFYRELSRQKLRSLRS